MGRIKRRDGPGRLVHITARVNWRVWHLRAERAKRDLARWIRKAAEQFDMALLAWVLMSNHLHLVIQSPPAHLFRRHTGRRTSCRHFRPWPAGHQNSSVVAQFMRMIRRGMSGVRQEQLGISGRFWEGEYDARVITDPWGLVFRIAYDNRNPVRAGIVPFPEEYRWSSAREWATGAPGEIPLTTGTHPFGMEPDELRVAVLNLQQSKTLDDLEEFLAENGLAWESEEGLAELRRELERRGVPIWPCGSRAAQP